MLRKKIPALPSQFEDVYQNYGRYSLLTDSERKTICKNVINKITNPMECARLLQNSGVENAWMEKRYAGELSHLRAPLNNETRYAEFAKDKVINEKILSMGGIVDDEFVKKMKEKTLSQDEIAEILSTDEMMKIDMPLHEEADKAIQIFYAGIIQASTGLGSSA